MLLSIPPLINTATFMVILPPISTTKITSNTVILRESNDRRIFLSGTSKDSSLRSEFARAKRTTMNENTSLGVGEALATLFATKESIRSTRRVPPIGTPFRHN